MFPLAPTTRQGRFDIDFSLCMYCIPSDAALRDGHQGNRSTTSRDSLIQPISHPKTGRLPLTLRSSRLSTIAPLHRVENGDMASAGMHALVSDARVRSTAGYPYVVTAHDSSLGKSRHDLPALAHALRCK
jgi:hypothetical protein